MAHLNWWWLSQNPAGDSVSLFNFEQWGDIITPAMCSHFVDVQSGVIALAEGMAKWKKRNGERYNEYVW